jgi:hypothetical protein
VVALGVGVGGYEAAVCFVFPANGPS